MCVIKYRGVSAVTLTQFLCLIKYRGNLAFTLTLSLGSIEFCVFYKFSFCTIGLPGNQLISVNN
jgi:hypothetical protein